MTRFAQSHPAPGRIHSISRGDKDEIQSQELYDGILNGNAKQAYAATQAAIEAGIAPLDLISSSMVPAMDEVGRLFEQEEYFVPELLLASRDEGGNGIASSAHGGIGREDVS